MQLDPNFALGWALLSYVDASGYLTQSLQPTETLSAKKRGRRPKRLLGYSPILARLCSQRVSITTLVSRTTTLP